MKGRISTEECFIGHLIGQRPCKKGFLDQVDKLIDWKPMAKFLDKHCKKQKSVDGRTPYPPLPLFKMLLIQRWYGLSDPGLEEAVNDRLSFLRFSGFSFESSIPDETTICRFRNDLARKGLDRKLLDQINRQLEKAGLLVRKGAAVDASLVSSARRPRKVIDVMVEDRREGQASPQVKHEVTYSDDREATWVRKGKRPHYGYKIHMGTDVKHGFILGGHVTSAHVADTSEFEDLVDELNLDEEAVVLADKGYASRKNREILKQRGFLDGIMSKAARNHPLSHGAKVRNKLISKLRYIVEQGFGTLKRRYRFDRARYVGRLKTDFEFHLTAMAFNIKKATAMLA